MMAAQQPKIIAFQGATGAYSDLACRQARPDCTTLPCSSFDDAFAAVQSGAADLAMIPVDNTIAGRVADVHHLLPGGGLFIVGEYFQPIRHFLLGVKGAKTQGLTHVHSHIHALPQCRKLIRALNLKPVVEADTGGAARIVAETNDPAHAAIASSLAAEIYGLDVIKADVQDEEHNTTRFLILSPQTQVPSPAPGEDFITTLLFTVRNIPAELYKCLGGFATNGLSLSKLESYVSANFEAARFFVDVEGHVDSPAFALALEELRFYARDVKILGTYTAHPFRKRT